LFELSKRLINIVTVNTIYFKNIFETVEMTGRPDGSSGFNFVKFVKK